MALVNSSHKCIFVGIGCNGQILDDGVFMGLLEKKTANVLGNLCNLLDPFTRSHVHVQDHDFSDILLQCSCFGQLLVILSVFHPWHQELNTCETVLFPSYDRISNHRYSSLYNLHFWWSRQICMCVWRVKIIWEDNHLRSAWNCFCDYLEAIVHNMSLKCVTANKTHLKRVFVWNLSKTFIVSWLHNALISGQG